MGKELDDNGEADDSGAGVDVGDGRPVFKRLDALVVGVVGDGRCRSRTGEELCSANNGDELLESSDELDSSIFFISN